MTDRTVWVWDTSQPVELSIQEPLDPNFRVQKMPIAGTRADEDRSKTIYKDEIRVAGIPDEAYRYMLASRSAIEWIMLTVIICPVVQIIGSPAL